MIIVADTLLPVILQKFNPTVHHHRGAGDVKPISAAACWTSCGTRSGAASRMRSIIGMLFINSLSSSNIRLRLEADTLQLASVPPLNTVFQNISAFVRLNKYTHEFGFILSYPKGNIEGYPYELWHWCYVAALLFA